LGTLALEKHLFLKVRCERLLGTPHSEKPFCVNERLGRSESSGWPEKAPPDSRCSMQFHKPQRQPIAAVSPFVMHAIRKATHQVDAEIAYFRLLERLCHRWGRELGGSNSLPLSSMRATSVPPLRSNAIAIWAVVFCAAAVHNDVGDSFLKAKLNCERGVCR
jgi:hypothetical protein